MNLGRECLACGRGFTGSARRAYCTPKCKDRFSNLRRRVRLVQIGLAHAQKQADLARLHDDPMGLHFYAWRVRQLRAELHILVALPSR